MKGKLQIGIIGLGKFGKFLGTHLMELGHDVIGLDNDENAVKSAQDVLTQVYVGDGTDRLVLEQLGFADFSHVVVSVGEAMEASILICLHLKEIKAPPIWVKAISPDHEKVLKKIGADQVFFPERYAARQMALRLTVPGFIEYLPLLGRGVLIQELTVNNWAGSTLRKLDLTNKHGIQIVAMKKAGEKDFGYLPKADQVLGKGDVLVVFVLGELAAEVSP